MNTFCLKEVVDKPISGEWGSDSGSDPEIKVIRNTNFTNEGKLDLSNVVSRRVSEKKIKVKGLLNGDIIIEKSGGSPNQPVGRVVYYDQNDGAYLFSNFTSALRPKENSHPKYLFYILFAHHKFGTTLSYQNKTTGIINLQLNRYVDEIKIPFPPLETQKKIAAILDKADALRQNDQQILQKYDQLTKSIFLDMFGDPFSNTKGLKTSLLKDIVKHIQIGPFGTQLHKSDYVRNGIPLINPTHIIKGKIEPNINFSIDRDKYNSLPNYHLRTGDIIMGRRGEMGRCAIVFEKHHGMFCGTGSLFIRPNPKLNPVYLHYAISGTTGKKYLENEAKGITMKNLNKTIIQNINIAVPPINLQNQFAITIEKIEKQKQLTQQSLQKSEELFQSLLQRAFKGELV